MEALLPLLFYLSLFSFFSKISTAGDIISPTSSIRDGETLISADGSFELGFFTPGSSKNRYLGIWYKKISTGTVVWVANRETPLTDSSGVLKILAGGILVLVNGTESVVWSSNSSTTVQNPVAKLLESGNLVVKDANSDDEPQNFLWQGFDYPCDTLLPGMKDGRDLRTGLNRYLSSWKSANDPSHGNYSFRIDPGGFPQLVLWKGSTVQFRAGSWNGLRFTGTPELKSNPVFTFNFISNQDEVYYTYTLKDPSVVSRFVVNQSGLVQRLTWINRTSDWVIFLTAQTDNCDIYSLCGSYGSCNIHNSPVCECLKGFVPRTPENWNVMDFSDGCVRRTTLNCRNGDGFVRYEGVKLPDTSEAWVNMSMSLKECEEVCLKNCSCTAYANSDIRGDGSGCLLWFGNLVDIREFGENGQDLYIRMANSELAPSGDSSKDKRVTLIITGVSLAVAMLLVGFLCYMSKRKKPMRRTKTGGYKVDNWKSYKDESPEDLELPLFDLVTIAEVTNNFCSENKLGEGGYGPVYKGKLVVGQEIAVKRLSKNSGQGINEFKNEVKLIAKLQHRNLVKLLGCCIEGEEKMLIYEYMPNKSLDIFIFDETRSTMLHWTQRYNIIDGIARGLLYLHQDSRLRIIHRDLKASNILLDDEMNPKISDFGMARTFRGDQTEENTRRVVGTYGYMSPEYATDGLFSVKSDVFSFGVLVLEIVSGKKNRGFYHPDHHHNLLGHAWRLWKEEKPLEFIDASLGDSTTLSQVFKCIHVGLLCVQQHPEDRPNMSSVLLMLGSATASLPQPKQPGFFTERVLIEQDSLSANEITVTLLEAR